MVRKVSVFLAAIVLATALCGQAFAAEIYDGNISTSMVTYFRDIVSGTGFNDNYVLWREGQYVYSMAVGDISYSSGTFTLDGEAQLYTIVTGTTGAYHYQVEDLTDFTLSVNSQMVYSNLGDFPQLVSRGENYETLTTLLLAIAMLCVVIRGIFRYR